MINKIHIEEWLRQILVSCTVELSDIEYQNSLWVNKEEPKKFWGELFTIIDVLFNDWLMTDKIEDMVGISLYDHHEAVLVKKLMDALDEVEEIVGRAKDSEEYSSSPSWVKVITAAKELLSYIEEQDHDKKYLKRMFDFVKKEKSKAKSAL